MGQTWANILELPRALRAKTDRVPEADKKVCQKYLMKLCIDYDQFVLILFQINTGKKLQTTINTTTSIVVNIKAIRNSKFQDS